MNGWINFKDLREKLDFEQVLRHYKVDVKRKGDQHLGFCPLPNHQGNKNSPSFSANLKRGIFQCFGCGSKGNLLEFAALMERLDPRNGAELRQVAVQLQSRFCSAGDNSSRKVRTSTREALELEEPKIENEADIAINQPLNFELKGLDQTHPYLLERGFTAETIRHFGLGFCNRGMLKDRLAIPLKDEHGRLIGYAGRVVDDAKISEENPRYRFPGSRIRDGKTYEFRKSNFLYNGYRMSNPVDDLVVVEGFCSIWWLHQHGFENAVATMGSDCSEKQEELIVRLVKPSGRVWIMPDGDVAGIRFAEALLSKLAPHRFVRWAKLDKNIQPTDLSDSELKTFFAK